VTAGSWPLEAPRLAPVAIDGDHVALELDGADLTAPVRHQGELLGAVTISKRPGEQATPLEERLVRDLAAQAGLVLSNVHLIQELRASRQRLVAAQDEERRKIERNLHDGAQQQLVALAVKQRLAEGLIERDPIRARGLMEELLTETTEALETLRDLAHGIYPPLLADKGLAAALAAQARRASVPVGVQVDDLPRYTTELEAAVYFCCLEALQNVVKYARASRATVTLSADEHALTFVVEDDGVGFETNGTPLGTGLRGMRDRLEALGGSFDVTSRPGSGTTVMGRLPTGAAP
jgi:signal transduction histidine kinase